MLLADTLTHLHFRWKHNIAKCELSGVRYFLEPTLMHTSI